MSILGTNHFARIPKLLGSLIRNENGCRPHVFLVRAELWHPNDVGCQSRVLILTKQLPLNFGRPPKTEWSGRTHKHEHAHLAAVSIESKLQLR